MSDYTLAVDFQVRNLGDFKRAVEQASDNVRNFGRTSKTAGDESTRAARAAASSARQTAGATTTAASAVRNYGATTTRTMASVGAAFTKAATIGKSTIGNPQWIIAHERQLKAAGKAASAFGLASAAGLTMAARSAMSWESAWAGVTKTVDGSARVMGRLQDDLRDLTRVLPASHEEIAQVAEVSGQLGVAAGDVAEFTHTMIDLGETTNLSAEEAATAIAQLSNVMGTPTADARKFGSALVDLGNNAATTERDILQMAQRIGAAGKLAGLSEAEVLGFSTAMASVGIQAEAGGTAFSQFISEVKKNVELGGDKLQVFARTAGMSVEEFSTLFAQDASGAVQAFIGGLGRLDSQGESSLATLDDLGLSGVRMSRMLQSMAQSGDLLAESLARADQAWDAGTALATEAAKRYETTEAKIQLAKNALRDSAIDIGAYVLPAIAQLADSVSGLAQWFSSLPGPVKEAIATLGGITAVVGTAGGAALIMSGRIARAVQDLSAMGVNLGKVSALGNKAAGAMGKFSRAVGKIGTVAVVAQLANTLNRGIKDWTAGVKQFEQGAGNMARRLTEVSESGSMYDAVLGDLIEANAISSVYYADLGDALNRLGKEGFAKVTDEATFFLKHLEGGNLDRIEQRFTDTGQALASLAQTSLPLATDRFKRMWEEVGGTEEAGRNLLRVMPDWRDQLAQIAESANVATDEQTLLQIATGELTNAQIESVNSTQAQEQALERNAEAVGMSVEAYQEAKEAHQKMLEAWQSASTGFVDIAGTYQGLLQDQIAKEAEAAGWTEEKKKDQAQAWKEFVDGVRVNLDEYMAALDEQVQAQENWQNNMISLAGRVSKSTLDYLAQMGTDGAPLVAALVDGSEAELKRFDELTSKSMEFAHAEFARTLDTAGGTFEQIGAAYGPKIAQAVADGVTSGAFTVEEAVATLGGRIEETLPGEYSVTFNADTSTAYNDVEAFKTAIESGETVAHIVGDTSAARASAEEYRQMLSGTPGVIRVDADPIMAYAGITMLKKTMDSTVGTVNVDADTSRAAKARGGLLRETNASSAKVRVGANTGPAKKAVRSLDSWAAKRTPTVSVHANTSGARTALNGLLAEFNRRAVTLTTRQAFAYASGGPVIGPGTSTSDSIPARLSNGEWVMNAKAVQKYGPEFMHAVNTRRFASGGPVDRAMSPGYSPVMPGGQHVVIHVGESEMQGYVDKRAANAVARARRWER